MSKNSQPLRAKVLRPDDLAAVVASRTAELADAFQPESPYEKWLVGEIAQATAKLDRCAELTILDLQRGIDRALLCWEADRRKAADDLGARLPRDPGRVARALSRSRQGADWMIEHWDGLGAVLQAHGGGDEAQRRLAFDLLGVAPELRDGSDKVPPAGDAAALAALVAEEVFWLRKAQELSLDALDEAEQAMAAAGMPLEEDAGTARLRRYEASARRALLWAQGELRRVRAGSPPSPASGPARDPSRTESTPAQSPLEIRPPLNASAMDYLAKRSPLVTPAMLLRTEDETPAVETPMVETPVAALQDAAPPVAEEKLEVKAPAPLPRPSRAMTSAFLSPGPRNRRERLAEEKKARQAARHSCP